MKTLLSAAALAIAFAAPAAEARTAQHHKTSQVTSGVQAKAATKKSGAKAKHKKATKKTTRKTA